MKRTDFMRLLHLTNAMKSFDDKLGKNAGLLLEELQPMIEAHNRKIKHLNITYAFVDGDGCLVLNEKQEFKYTPQQFSEMQLAIEQFMQEEVDLDSFKNKFITNPKDSMRLNSLTEIPEDFKILQGFLI